MIRTGQSGNLRKFVIALVVIGSVLTGMLTFSGGVFAQFSTDLDDSQQFEEFEELAGNTQNQTLALAQQQKNSTAGISGDIASSVFVLGSVFQVMNTVFNALTNVELVIDILLRATPLPNWMFGLVKTIITVIIIFTIVSAYRAYKV